MIVYTDGNKDRATVAILISDEIEFKSKIVTRDQEGIN